MTGPDLLRLSSENDTTNGDNLRRLGEPCTLPESTIYRPLRKSGSLSPKIGADGSDRTFYIFFISLDIRPFQPFP